jgi:hypothetical protein
VEPSAYCPAASLFDSFEQSELDPVWRQELYPADCTYELDGDSLNLSVIQASPQCGLGTNRAFNLSESAMELRFDPPLAITNGTFSLGLAHDSDNILRLHADSDSVWTSMSVAGVTTSTSKVLLNDVSRMRLLHESGHVRWEVEAGGSILVLEDQPTPFELNGLNAGLFFGASAGNSVRVSGVNAD